MRRIIVIILILFLYSSHGYAVHWNPPLPSSESMHLAGSEFFINGNSAQAGDEVAVFDPGGQLVGHFVVDTEGQYGDMAIFGDSSQTPDTDEGASSGDVLSFRVWDASTLTEYEGESIQLIIPDSGIGPYNPPDSLPLTYSVGAFYLLDIEAGSCTPTPEICDDEIDNDCDGFIDSNDPDCIPLADLAVTSVSNPPKKIKRGKKFMVKDTTKNTGGKFAGKSRTCFYLSLDTNKDDEDIQLKKCRNVKKLVMGKKSSGKTKVKIPKNTVPGRYYLLSCANDINPIPEHNRENNCKASRKMVRVKR